MINRHREEPGWCPMCHHSNVRLVNVRVLFLTHSCNQTEAQRGSIPSLLCTELLRLCLSRVLFFFALCAKTPPEWWRNRQRSHITVWDVWFRERWKSLRLAVQKIRSFFFCPFNSRTSFFFFSLSSFYAFATTICIGDWSGFQLLLFTIPYVVRDKCQYCYPCLKKR